MNESNQEILINMPEEMILTCEFYGVPKPIIKWFKVKCFKKILLFLYLFFTS